MIGVDTDQYLSLPEAKSILVSSAEKLITPSVFNIIKAAIPCVFGGISYTVQPRYVVEIGVTHSGWKSARSSKVIAPPNSFEMSTMACAVGPL